MKLVTPKQMKEIDRAAINKVKIPGVVLMENAGLGLFEIIQEEMEGVEELRIGIVCGKGNNGGDGFVLARHLLNNGADVAVFILGKSQEIKGDAKTNLNILLNTGFKIAEIKTKKDIRAFKKTCPQFDLLVDAIFGTGFQGKVTGIAKDMIEVMNEAGIPMLAVDVPSGVNASDGSIKGSCIRADFTGTMCLPKRGLFLYPGRDYAGEVYVIDIGVPEKLWEHIDLELPEVQEMWQLLPERPGDSHKGTFGRVFVLAGSKGMTGAAALTAMSALKIGAGLVRLGIPESLNSILEEKVTEVITVPLPETPEGTIGGRALKEIVREIEKSSVLAIGPGLSTHPETKELIKKLIPKIGIPVVIDADGVNNLTLNDIKKIKAPTVITPHPGELSRLAGLTINQIQQARVDKAFQFAKQLEVTFVLKGAPTIIADAQKGYLNPTGNSGLASGGSGDVLTGMIAGLLAQGLTPIDAARLGVYLHGLAADVASEELTEYSLIASDVMNAIPDAIKRVEEDTLLG